MEAPVWFDLARDYAVLEPHEYATAPGRALELHVVRSQRLGLVAWWMTDRGKALGFVEVDVA
jgi:hypothetical protein